MLCPLCQLPTSIGEVKHEQPTYRVLAQKIDRPLVGPRDRRIERGVGVHKPLWAGVVEARQRAILEWVGGCLVATNRPVRKARNRLVDPLDPLGRV